MIERHYVCLMCLFSEAFTSLLRSKSDLLGLTTIKPPKAIKIIPLTSPPTPKEASGQSLVNRNQWKLCYTYRPQYKPHVRMVMIIKSASGTRAVV